MRVGDAQLRGTSYPLGESMLQSQADRPLSSHPQMNGTAVLANTYGAYSATVYPPGTDIPALVLNDLSSAYALMGVPLPSTYSSTLGLNTGYSYGARIVGTKVGGNR